VGRSLQAFGRTFWVPALVALLAVGVILVPVVALALAPDAPQNLVVTPGATQPVLATLTWEAPSGGSVDRYRVYAANNSAGPFSIEAETLDLEFSFTDGIAGLPYYFKVSALNSDDEESDASSVVGPVTAGWSADPHRSYETNTSTCAKCHSTHSASNGLLQRPEAPTGEPASIAICYTCHDGLVAGAGNIASGEKGFSQPSGHSLEGTSGAGGLTESCTSCHGNHRDPAEAPMIPRNAINGVALDGPGTAWCYSCHETEDWFEGTYPPMDDPTLDEDGYPIEGTWPGKASYESSANAHSRIPETTQTVDTGAVARERGDCLYCHSAHGGKNEYDGLIGTYRPTSASTLASDQATGAYADSCFQCHGGVLPSGFATAPVDIKQFVTDPGVNAGHRIKTSGGLLPVGAPMPCYECHGPHGSTRGNESLISDTLGQDLDTATPASAREFCFTCHTTADTGKGWESADSTYTVPAGTDLVVGLSRVAGSAALRLPALSGHNEADAASCNTCHGGSYSAGGANVHNPGTGSADPAAHTSSSSLCFGSGCHATSRLLSDVHAEFVGDPAAKYSQYPTTCALCHDNSDELRIDWDTATAECVSCHAGYHGVTPGDPVPHDNRTVSHTVTAASDACTGCHSDTLMGTHGATDYDETLCAGCHTVHPTANAACDKCHSSSDVWGKTADCVSCHADMFDGGAVGSSHYDAGLHTATPFSAAYQGSGSDGLVNSGGKECSICHSDTLATAHSATSASGGSITCAECHLDESLGSSATVDASWPINKCTDCHDSGAATTHDSFSTTHTVEPGTCAGTGASCHDFTNLASLHEVGQSGGAPNYLGCGNADPGDPSSCHNVVDTRPSPINPAASCGEGSGGCHADKNAGNHGYSAALHTATLGAGDVDMGIGIDDIDHGASWSFYIDCSTCHYTDLATQHGSKCATCHAGANPVASLGGAWTGSCQQADCHPSIHTGMQPDHNGAYFNSSSSCDSCHTGSPDWPGDPDCTRCHAPADTIPDTVAPVTTSDAQAGYVGNATITFAASDGAGGSGVDRTYSILDGGAPVQGASLTVTAPASGSEWHTLQYYSVDVEGNTEIAKPSPAFGFIVSAP